MKLRTKLRHFIPSVTTRPIKADRARVEPWPGVGFWWVPSPRQPPEMLAASYEPEVSRALWRLLTPGCTFLDIGANTGYFTLLVAAWGQAASVVAFEPDPRNVVALEANAAANPELRFEVMAAAVAGRSGRGQLLQTRNGANSRLEGATWPGQKPPVGSCDVSKVQLSAFLAADRSTIVKVDCEGAELEILRDMATMPSPCLPTGLIVECHGESNQNLALALLLGLGYNVSTLGSSSILAQNRTEPAL